ncbi:porin [Roseobacter sinensis]|uniref:Porin n=1 Tax=Roseobacter sinensis TaxID=2931391 RepID=A0ABT3BLA2_9RHOB|nr:porin [Roseobacter sp. WL0113]MCV3274351.1 porin [Roseobacter sp. WL0113]
MTYSPRIPPASAGLIALALPLPAIAQQAGPEVDFYGHLNLGIINVDRGDGSNTTLTDNDNSNSRVGVIYTQALQGGSEFRLHFETALGFTGSSSINGADDGLEQNYRRTEIRKFEAIYQSPTFGTVSFGQGSIATDSTAEADFSGTSVIAYSSLQDQAGSQVFQLAGGGASAFDIGDAFSAFDGGRRFRIRYDTPAFAGFSLAVSAGEEVLARGNDDEFYDIGLTYNQDYGAYQVAARTGLSIRDSDEELLLGSVAILHEATGLNLAVATGRQQEGDAGYVYVKGGIKRDWIAAGETRISVDYYSGEDFGVTGSDSQSVGLAVVQMVDAWNTELYASYRTFEFDDTGADLLDQDVTFVGARWRF